MSAFASNPKNVDGNTETEDAVKSEVLNLNDYIINYDNILLKYENPTYHFKLYTFNSRDYKKYQMYDSTSQFTKIVLAESGVTGKYTIEDVEIVLSAPGQSSTKNGTAIMFKMTLTEHRGMYFFDELTAISLKYGYSKFADIPLILELSFVGFDPFKPDTPKVIPNSTRTWRVNINKAPGSIKESGTVYDLELTPQSFNYNQNKWQIGQAIEIIAGTTVQETLEYLEVALNNVADAQYGYMSTLFPNDIDSKSFYKLRVAPTVGSLPMINDDTQNTASDSTLGNTKGTRKFNFKPTDTIGTIIDDIMDCAVTGDDSAQRATRQYVHVIPNNIYIGYDPYRNKDTYKHEVYIVPYTVADVQDVYDIRNNYKAVDSVNHLQQSFKTTKINAKRYDYTWSGDNTEILKLDLDMNVQYNYAANRNIESLIQQANFKGLKISDAVIENQIVNSVNLPQMYKRNIELSNRENLTQAEEAEYLRNQEKINAIVESNKNIEGESEQSSVKPQDLYVEDISDAFDISSYGTENTNTGTVFMNVPIEYQNIKDNSSSSDVSNTNIDEVLKRSAKSNYYNDSFLVKLEMDVVGDPYWLGLSELDLVNELKELSGQERPLENKDNGVFMSNLIAEPYLVLNLEPPRDINNQGLMSHSRGHILSQSLYRVIKIVSRFEKGQFTQTLTCGIIKRTINRRNDAE